MCVATAVAELLLYASGAGRQGRVSCELQNTITLSLLWHPLFFAPTQRRTTCAGLRQMRYILLHG